MCRGPILVALLLASTIGCQPPAPSTQPPATPGEPEPPPSLILVVADDLGWGDLGCYGSEQCRTPNIDGLASEGARFTSFYANAPICSPSRASILSGVLPAGTGIVGALLRRARDFDSGRLRNDVRLLPEWLGEAGYRSVLVGKWHLGEKAGELPGDHGFAEFTGYPAGASYDAAASPSLTQGGKPWRPEGLLPRVLGDEAVRTIEESGEQPLFLLLSFKSPHKDLTDAKPFLADEIAAHRARGVEAPEALYYAVVEELDLQVGRVLDALERSGRARHAVVAFVSDNGPDLTMPGSSAGPFRQGKGSLLEGGIRVPALLRWPGRIPANKVVETPVAGCDLFATFLGAAGRPVPAVNGAARVDALDLVDATQGRESEFLERDLFWFVRKQIALRLGRWKLWLSVDGAPSQDWDAALQAVDSAVPGLFDLDAAQPEQLNVAKDWPEVVDQLRRRLRARLLEAQELTRRH